MTWYEKVLPFLGKFSSYVSGQTEPIELSPINIYLLREVIAQWLAEFYVERQLMPPTPVYPFEVYQFQALIRENLTLQEAIDWCADNFKPVEVDPIEKIERIFQELLEIDWERELKTDRYIVEALYFSFKNLVGKTVCQMKIETVNRHILPKQDNQNYLQFQIVGMQKDQRSSVGIAVLQSRTGRTVGAAFKRLVSADHFSLTRTCLVRSKTQKILPTWKAYADFEIWRDRCQGRWVDVNPEAITPLLALYELYRQRDRYQLTDARISEFLNRSQLLENHPTITAILRSPPEETPKPTTEIETSCPLIPPTPPLPNPNDPLCESPTCPSFQQDEL
jgi:hypothetical protein